MISPDDVDEIIRRAEKRAEDEWQSEHQPEVLDSLPDSSILLKTLIRRGDLWKEGHTATRATMQGHMHIVETYQRIYRVDPDA